MYCKLFLSIFIHYKPNYISIRDLKNMSSRQALPPRTRRGSSQEKRSSEESFDSVINDLCPQQSKFCTAFIENWEIFHAFVCSFQIIQPHHLFGAKFITYRIKIITDHITYTIQKRYRDFLQLYNKVSLLYNPTTQFPKKTHFRSKVCPLLTENRRKLFDDFMSELIAMRNFNKSVVAQFITFLNVKTYYNQKQLDETIFSVAKIPENIKSNPSLFGHLLRHQLIKIDAIPNQSLRYLQRIQSLLNFSNRGVVKTDDLKTLFLGFNKISGLIQFGCSTSNQVVALSFLKTIKKLMSSQLCPYSEVFKKILEIAPARYFLLQHQQMLKNQQFFSNYFQLVQFYLKARSNVENQPSFQMLIRQVLRPNVIKQFVEWKTGRRTVQNQIRRKTQLLQIPQLSFVGQKKQRMIQSKASSELEDNESFQDHYQVFDEQVSKLLKKQINQRYQQIYRYRDSYCQVCPNKNFMHFSIQTMKGYYQIQQILKKWSHNKLVKSFYGTQKLTNICKLFISAQNGGEKLFQLYQKVNKNILKEQQSIQNCEDEHENEQREIQICYTPPKELSNINSFFFYAKATPHSKGYRNVEIIYYFPMKRVRKIFNDQFTKQGKQMWESITNEFFERDEIFSGQNGSYKSDSTI